MSMKGTRLFFNDDPSELNNINDLAQHLHSLISSSSYVETPPWLSESVLIEAKGVVKRIDGLKIEIRSNEHPPPHFHVIAPNINASFCIEKCTLINGDPGSKIRKKIEYWFHKQNAKEALINVWNKTRPLNCVVGEFRE